MESDRTAELLDKGQTVQVIYGIRLTPEELGEELYQSLRESHEQQPFTLDDFTTAQNAMHAVHAERIVSPIALQHVNILAAIMLSKAAELLLGSDQP
ncbi:MAG: hypothetical protein TR69_WS6001000030 [candidate division WS6 bacterium OLB20]|uniref:Uncharacterized protein n=1 Tax=candidate division WS6 bacterium OLB20 TaxID=1617426 RepID=A0A136M132_9BACT|nr:MAG: hypothetical protein TR69_WS6001000030 [candidate division WS6 bacterium OLB20]